MDRLAEYIPSWIWTDFLFFRRTLMLINAYLVLGNRGKREEFLFFPTVFHRHLNLECLLDFPLSLKAAGLQDM